MSAGQGTHDVRTRGERHNEQGLANKLRRNYFRVLINWSKVKDSGFSELSGIKFPYRRTNPSRLVVDARAIIRAARPFSPAIERVLGRGWLDEFAAAADVLEQSTDVKFGSRHRRVGATAAIESLIKRARVVVSAVNAMVVAHLPEKSPLLDEWKVPLREFRSAGRKRKPSQG